MLAIAVSGLIALTAVFGTGAAPAPADELSSVSCVTSRYCVAVGLDLTTTSNGTGVPLIQTWNGSAWKTVATKPLGAKDFPELLGVSCASVTACVAVGFYLTGTDKAVPFADTWNGRTWTPRTMPSPAGARDVNVNGVSCPAADSCLAVGQYSTPAGAFPLAESWNGRTWSIGKPPPPAGSGELRAVSCTSPAFCVAAGTYIPGTGAFRALLLLYARHGRTWTKMTARQPVAGMNFTFANGISCTSPARCVAVGGAATSYTGFPHGFTGFAELWKGKTWTGTTISWPKGTANSNLTGVSCGSATSCVAAGYIDSLAGLASRGGRAAAASWNGKAWTAANVPAPGSGKSSQFDGVSCLSADSCVAAGRVGPLEMVRNGLAGFWNGKRWKLVTTP